MCGRPLQAARGGNGTEHSPHTTGRDQSAVDTVLQAVSNVVASRIRERARSAEHRSDPAPMLIHIEGPGKSEVLHKLQDELDPCAHGKSKRKRRLRLSRRDREPHTNEKQPTDEKRRPAREPQTDGRRQTEEWTAILFDAWQHQRLDPPWWWLMSAIDKQTNERFRRIRWTRWLRHRSRDVGGRVAQLGRDLLWAVPGILLLLAGWKLGWKLQGKALVHAFSWLLTAAGGIVALVALVSSLGKAAKRHLLTGSPEATKALLRTSDPLQDLLRRYGFLVHSARTGMLVLIDNLDRCRADYVVEMLEGIQTLLGNQPEPGHTWLSNLRRWPASAADAKPKEKYPPLVAFVVAADRSWLCESYMAGYKDFEATAREPGRPFGLAFLDKIFEYSLRIPTVPAAASVQARSDPSPSADDRSDVFTDCKDELAVRDVLRAAENQAAPATRRRPIPPPVLALRIGAVKRLAELEADARAKEHRRRTPPQLDDLLAELDPGPIVQRQLETAYCVNRTAQLLAGHAVDTDEHALYCLGLWTILELKWPLLAAHLSCHPTDLATLARQPAAKQDADTDLARVLEDPMIARIKQGVCGASVTVRLIEQMTTPLFRVKPDELAAAA
jgi:KAP family P-loop domain